MFLGLVYPGRGLETSVRKEHLESMTTADYVKVWKVHCSMRMCSGQRHVMLPDVTAC